MERSYKRADGSTDMESGETKLYTHVGWKSHSMSSRSTQKRTIQHYSSVLSFSSVKERLHVQNKTLSFMHGASLFDLSPTFV